MSSKRKAFKISSQFCRHIAGLFIVALLSMLTACAGTRTQGVIPATPEVIESLQRYSKEFLINPGDQLEVVVYRSPDVSRLCIVRSDGYISLPILDDVKATGLTIKELDDKLTSLFSVRLVDPEVTVIVTNPREPMVYVIGDVGKTTAIPLRQAHTAAEAIAQVGGMLRSAALDSVAVVRLDESGHLKAYTVDKEIAGQPALYMALQNIALQPDDLIVVPESGRSQAVRAIQDFITTPLTALNQVLSPYFQFSLLNEVQKNN